MGKDKEGDPLENRKESLYSDGRAVCVTSNDCMSVCSKSCWGMLIGGSGSKADAIGSGSDPFSGSSSAAGQSVPSFMAHRASHSGASSSTSRQLSDGESISSRGSPLSETKTTARL